MTQNQIQTSDIHLPVMEHFSTIQGEGYHQGNPAYFIRLAGCDVGCVWCDVKESWDESKHPLIRIDTIVQASMKYPTDICVITGGEPLMHDLARLTESLQSKGKKTHLETSGAYPLSGQWDWICISPKKFKPPLTDVLLQADELKVIIYHPSDLEWATSYAGKVKGKCKLYLQPEWDKSGEMLPLILDFVKNNPQWALSLQIHKYLNIP